MNIEKVQSGKSWIGVIIIILLIAGGFWFFSYKKTPTATVPAVERGIYDLTIFSKGLAAAGITADQVGFSSFSPSGRYFMFTAFTYNTEPANTAYLLDTKTDTFRRLPGVPDRAIRDDRIMQLYDSVGVILYWLESGESKKYDISEAYYGILSPNGKQYLVNTANGIAIIDINSNTIENLTKNKYDGGYAWFSDNKRVLGFRSTGENLFEAGEGREVGVWNIEDGSFTSLSAPIDQKSIRMVEWIVPNKVARINAGWDDGSFDYLVDVTNGKTVSVGETSGALTGGIVVDEKRSLFAVVGGDDLSASGSRAFLYKGMEKKYDIQSLERGYFREDTEIVSEKELLYIRKNTNSTGTDKVELILLDLANGTETVLRELPLKTFTALTLASDYNTYIVSSDASFIIGTIK